MLINTDKTWFRRHLSELGIGAGQKIAVHSSLMAFGRIEGGDTTVFESLVEAVSRHGALAFPTFTFSCTEDIPFDSRTSVPEGCGRLSEHAFRRPEGRRTINPMHSYVLFGESIENLLHQSISNRSYGDNSIFDLMERDGWYLLLLGTNMNSGATYLHHLEEVAQVPYRSTINLKRSIRNQEKLESIDFQYFGRSSTTSFTNDFSVAERDLREAGAIASALAPYGSSMFIKMSDLGVFIRARLAADPIYLLKK